MKRERVILISVVTAALVMVLLCIFFTSDRAVSVKKLKKCVPDEVHFEEDGREQYDFLICRRRRALYTGDIRQYME